MRYSLLAAAAALAAVGAFAFGLRVERPEISARGPGVTAKLERTIALGEAPAREPRFSRDGRLLALTSAAGPVYVVRTSDWRAIRRFEHPGGATSAAFAGDGRRLYTSGYDGIVRSWDVVSGRPGTPLKVSTVAVWTLDISRDGSRLAIGDLDGVARVWKLDSLDRPERVLRGHRRNIWEIQFSPVSADLATGSFDFTARLWDLAAGRTIRELRGHSQAIVGLDYGPDGRLIATSGDDSTIRLWRVRDGRPVRTITAGNHTYDVEFSPDGRWLASSGRARSTLGTALYDLTGLGRASAPVHVWRVSDGALVAALPHPADVSRLAFSPDGRHLVTADDNGRVRIWRVAPR